MDGETRLGTACGLGSVLLALLLALASCGAEEPMDLRGGGSSVMPPVAGTTATAAAASGASGAQGSGTGAGGAAGVSSAAGSGAGPGGATAGAGAAGMTAAGAGGADPGGAGTGPAAGAGGASDPMLPVTGPVDGDPTRPMVALEGVPCGAPNVGFGAAPPSVKITDRDVVVAYPCAHEGAPVTFFLFLHGTLQEAQKVAFTMNAFPIHKSVDSHNVIVVVPKALGTQWGNGDGGADLPHLYEVVDWVYETFGTKFDIRSMWASGGSWGAFYLSRTFACDPRFEDRLRGVRMVVGSPCPSCSNRLACIVAEQELEEGGGMPLSADQQEMKSSSNIDMFASGHGCGAKTKMPDLGPVRHWTWPDCDPGFAHSYYLGPGQHADPWNDPTALAHMVDEIKSIE